MEEEETEEALFYSPGVLYPTRRIHPIHTSTIIYTVSAF